MGLQCRWPVPAATQGYVRQSSPGTIRRMNSSKSGTVNAVSPWLGLQTMPLVIKVLRVGAETAVLPDGVDLKLFKPRLLDRLSGMAKG